MHAAAHKLIREELLFWGGKQAMSYQSFSRIGPTLDTAEISKLASILRQVCEECGEMWKSEKATHCAGVLIRSYQRGIEETEVLLDIGRAVCRA